MTMNREKEWMMAALDDEISAADRAALEEALAGNEELRREWERLLRVKEATSMMHLRKPPPETWQDYWNSVYARFERGVAWIFISVGFVILSGWGAWELIQEITADADVPLLIKLAMAGLFAGFAILLISVIREKLFVRRTDPYKDIQR